MGGRKVYKKKMKLKRYCAECLDEIITNRPNQTHCAKAACQQIRNTAKMNRFILKKAKELTNV